MATSARDEELDAVPWRPIEPVELRGGLVAHQRAGTQAQLRRPQALTPRDRAAGDAPHAWLDQFQSTRTDPSFAHGFGDTERGESVSVNDTVVGGGVAGHLGPRVIVGVHTPGCA